MKEGKTYEQLLEENRILHDQLEEATETITAIRTGQVDALVVNGADGHQLYTLKTADQTYRVFIEKMNEGAVTLNRDGVILYCNSKFASTVGLPLYKVIGLSFRSFIAKEYLEIYNSIFEDGWIADGKAEVFIIGEERQIPFQLSVTTLDLDEGFSMSVILTDLTFQKDIEKLLILNNQKLAETNVELEKSNHDLQQFASVASHDLQEPLRKILIFATLLRDKHALELSGDGPLFLDKIIASSNRMKTMIFDILSYSRLAANNDNFVKTDLREVVSEVLEDYEIVIAEKKALVTVGNLPTIEVNRGQIRQVFQNLISNALKFAKPDEPPVIKIEPKIVFDEHTESGNKEQCTITVTDNGIGFDDLYVEKIFSLFQRLNTKDKYEGSGIGLAITKKIIDKHYGKIAAVSKEGEGAEFTITLPVRHNKNI
ncbi:sensor histidine kinase [Dyadobacter psychrotolerans]|uniref:histidine kinase n=1 Tax=Dyadobacter psychrotolerans TaxID=2541721 RepID=A0A4R5DJF8_9BACT|nr:ATP-binding protein [Dyadobacter psychrotolerans]TDE12094.1 PAS domain S-box protein [Dyadobacter psychrotolerans]